MTQIVIRHYDRPARYAHLWTGLAMSLVAIVFALEQGIAWLAGI